MPFSFWPSSCHQQVVVGCVPEAGALRPLRDEVESHCRNKQRDGKMDEHHMLRVLGQKNCLGIEWIYHGCFLFLDSFSPRMHRLQTVSLMPFTVEGSCAAPERHIPEDQVPATGGWFLDAARTLDRRSRRTVEGRGRRKDVLGAIDLDRVAGGKARSQTIRRGVAAGAISAGAISGWIPLACRCQGIESPTAARDGAGCRGMDGMGWNLPVPGPDHRCR
jgi:hypothetical protein